MALCWPHGPHQKRSLAYCHAQFAWQGGVLSDHRTANPVSDRGCRSMVRSQAPNCCAELLAALLTPWGCVLAHGIDLASVAATPRTSLRRGAGRVARRAGHPTLWCSV